MEIKKQRSDNWIWWLIYLIASGCAYALLYFIQFKAHGFHSRDYVFYTEFIIKAFGPKSEQFYTLNPGGFNFLGMAVVDGCDGFYQAIHFEPFRLVQALVYRLFNSIHAVFIFNALLVCSPILAIPKWLNRGGINRVEKAGWVLFFIFFPSTLVSLGFDNRPLIFFGITYFWQLFVLLTSKNRALHVLLFFLLFLMREEALILNAFVILFHLMHKENGKRDWAKLVVYGIIYLGFGISWYAYIQYWGYKPFNSNLTQFNAIGMGGTLLLIIGFIVYALVKRRPQIVLFTPVVFFIYQFTFMYIFGKFVDPRYSPISDPRNMTWFMVVVPFLIWLRVERIEKTKWLAYTVGILIPAFLFFSLIGYTGVVNQLKIANEKISKLELVHDIKEEIEEGALVLTDYSTHQAFVGRPNTFCYERLPCKMYKGHERFFPANTDFLIPIMVKNTILVMSQNGYDQLLSKFPTVEMFLLDKNDYYIIARIL